CTPTGAALVATLVRAWEPLPPLRPVRVGVGAGGRDPDQLPNVVRLVLGDPVAPDAGGHDDGAVVLETNVDDLDPRLWPGVLDRRIGVKLARIGGRVVNVGVEFDDCAALARELDLPVKEVLRAATAAAAAAWPPGR